MFQTIAVPVWLAILVGLLAAWSMLSRLLIPSVRWIWTRRINRLTERINRRLALKIPPIARTKREVLIDRLIHDPKVLREVTQYCEREQVPYAVAMKRVEHYAREIVPSFNAYAYFRVGSGMAKRIVELLYRVRLGHADYKSIRALGGKGIYRASVVFVMNHRSNMDYLLIGYLASKRMALSYAVGEWAKVWPIQQIIRTLGAYFVRRGSGDSLYRRVLERYVQMAVDGGAVQAIFPEGGLSRDGLLRQPKIGLLDYMLRAFDPLTNERDIVFVPVAINYDRVLEDRTLLLDSGGGERKSGFAAVKQSLWFLFSQLGLMIRGKWYRFGYACANFGTPISLRAYLNQHGWNPTQLDPAARGPHVEQLAAHLLMSVGRIVPVLPVSVIARIFVDAPGESFTESEIKARALTLQQQYQALGAHVYIPRDDADYSVAVGLRMLTLRRLVIATEDRFSMDPQSERLLRYYANAIAHLTIAPHWHMKK
jgi:glycerol-3-phosphate O-acyltransferase